MLGRGARVYVDAYQEGLKLYAIGVGPEGGLEAGAGLQVTPRWGRLMDAKGSSAYVTIGGGSIAWYDFGSGEGQLGRLVPVMTAPTRIHFGRAAAYAAIGYSGVVELPL